MIWLLSFQYLLVKCIVLNINYTFLVTHIHTHPRWIKVLVRCFSLFLPLYSAFMHVTIRMALKTSNGLLRPNELIHTLVVMECNKSYSSINPPT